MTSVSSEPGQLPPDRRRALADVVHREELDGRPVEQILLQRVRVAHRGQHDVALRQRGVEPRLEPHPRQAVPGGDGHRHAAQHPAERGLGRVEVAVRVDEHEAHAQGPRRGARVLQPAQHAHQAAAVGQRPTGTWPSLRCAATIFASWPLARARQFHSP
jgi:hypothetical protein